MKTCSVSSLASMRVCPAKEAAIRTYDRRRMMGGSKDDATTAAFMTQAYHICTAFDFLCFPCFALGFCRDPTTKYRQFDDEEAPLPFPTSPAVNGSYGRVVPRSDSAGRSRPSLGVVGSSRQVLTTRKMFDMGHEHVKPINYDPPPTPPPIPLNLLEQMMAAATPPPPPPPPPEPPKAPAAEPPKAPAAEPPKTDGPATAPATAPAATAPAATAPATAPAATAPATAPAQAPAAAAPAVAESPATAPAEALQA